MCTCYPQGPEKGSKSLGMGELNPGPLQERQELLTAKPNPPLFETGSGWLETLYVEQADLQFRVYLSVSPVLGLKVCVIIPGPFLFVSVLGFGDRIWNSSIEQASLKTHRAACCCWDSRQEPPPPGFFSFPFPFTPPRPRHFHSVAPQVWDSLCSSG